MFVNVPPMLPTHSLPYQRHFFSKSVIAICRREDKAQYKDIHLSVCVSCLMSGAGSLIYPAMRGRRICMRSMKQQTATIGRSLQNATSRNFKKAAQRGNVSKRGNLSLPCPNPSQISMRRTSCYSCSQTALRKSMVWSVYRLCTIINERQTTISTLIFQRGRDCLNP